MHHPIAKNQKGSALIFAMMVLLVLSILGTAMLGVVVGHYRTSAAEREFSSAYYIAEAGATYHMKLIKKEIMEAYSNTANPTEFFNAIETYRILYPEDMNTFEIEYGSQPNAEVSFERLDALGSNPCTYRLTSKGTLDDSTRNVTKEFKVQWVSGFMSVFSKGQMILNNGAIVGPIGTNDTGTDAILVTGNPSIQDINLLTGAGMVPPSPSWLATWDAHSSSFTLNEPKTFNMPMFPAFPVYGKMTDEYVGPPSNRHKVIDNGSVKVTDWQAENYVLNLPSYAYIPVIQINSNRNLYINVGSTDKVIVVDDIILDSGHIHLIGDGKLTIYLKNNIILSAGSGINRPTDESNVAQASEAIKHLVVYMKGSDVGVPHKTLTMAGSQKIYGSLFAEDANLIVTGGGGFQGSIVTGGETVEISGGTRVVTSILYAPNAAVSLSGGGSLLGPIVSNTFYLTGGGNVSYNPLNGIVYNPFNVEVGTNLFDLIPMDGAIREK